MMGILIQRELYKYSAVDISLLFHLEYKYYSTITIFLKKILNTLKVSFLSPS